MRTLVTALVVAASVFSALARVPGEDPTKPVPWSCAPGACDQSEPLTAPAVAALPAS